MGDGPLHDGNKEGITIPPILCPFNEAQHSLLCGEDNGNSESFGTRKYLIAWPSVLQSYKLLSFGLPFIPMHGAMCVFYIWCVHMTTLHRAIILKIPILSLEISQQMNLILSQVQTWGWGSTRLQHSLVHKSVVTFSTKL